MVVFFSFILVIKIANVNVSSYFHCKYINFEYILDMYFVCELKQQKQYVKETIDRQYLIQYLDLRCRLDFSIY